MFYTLQWGSLPLASKWPIEYIDIERVGNMLENTEIRNEYAAVCRNVKKKVFL